MAKFLKGYIGGVRWTRGTRRSYPPRPEVVYRKERREFLGYVGRFATYGLMADVGIRLWDRMGSGYELQAQSETILERPSGTYNMAGSGGFADTGGTSGNIRRYRPRPGAVCVIRGGWDLEISYITIDGKSGANGFLTFDGSLDPKVGAPSYRSAPINNVMSNNVTIENAVLKGAWQGHYGYAVDGSSWCDEADATNAVGPKLPRGGIGWSGTNGVMRDCVVIGDKNGLGGVRGGLRCERVLFRNVTSAGGIESVNGSNPYLEVDGCVFWDIPNHGLSGHCPGSGGRIDVRNSLFGPTQEVMGIGNYGAKGVDEFYWIHNTIYTGRGASTWPHDGNPANPVGCGYTEGLNISGPDGGVRLVCVIRDNVFWFERKAYIQFAAGSGNLTTGASNEIDYNLYHTYDPAQNPSNRFKIDGSSAWKTFETWKVALAAKGIRGRDAHSLETTGQNGPVFADPPVYANPQPIPGTDANHYGFRIAPSLAAARSWFILQAGSLGKKAASDGLDMGINGVVPSITPPSDPTAPRSPTNLRIVG